MLSLVKCPSPFLLGEHSDRVLKSMLNISTATVSSQKREVVKINASEYKSGDISYLTAASLLGDSPVLVIEKAETLTDDLIADIKKYAANAASYQAPTDLPDVLIKHSGAVRGKAMIEAMKKASSLNPKVFYYAEISEPKKSNEKLSFVKSTFSDLGKTISNEAAIQLVEYEGDDLGILVGYIKQLANDLGEQKNIDLNYLNQFFSGIKQVKPWDIINAALDMKIDNALTLYRHAIHSEGVSGVTPGLITMMLNNINDLLKVQAMSSRGLTARDLGKQDWQIGQIKSRLGNFAPNKLQKIFDALLVADKASKGNSADGGVLAFEDVLRVIAC